MAHLHSFQSTDNKRQKVGRGAAPAVRGRRRRNRPPSSSRQPRGVSAFFFLFALGYMCKCNKEFGMIENSLDLTERRGRSLLGWMEENGDIYTARIGKGANLN